MVRVSPIPLLAISGFLLSCLFPHSPALAKVKWKEIDKALLAETQGIVDPGAPSETVDWEVQLIDSYDGKGFRSEVVHYRRVKIFNDRGRELEGTIEIPYARGERIYDVAGRTIRPNGTVVELQKDAVFDRTTVKARRLKGKAKSFAMPGVEPGAVIEYQWTSVRRDEAVLILYAQRVSPVRSMTMVLTPVTDPDWEMRVRSFNMQYPEPEKQNRSMTIRLEGIRGIEKEPYMPPDDQVRPWFLIDYTDRRDRRSTDEFWKEAAKSIHEVWKPTLDVTPPVRRTADSLTAGTVDFSERIRVLHDFCRTRIRSVYDDAYDFTDEFRSKLLEDEKRMPEETLRRGYGTDADINLLFAALTQAAGFKSRLAFVADRSEIFFRRENRLPFQLSEHVVAIHVSGEWKFYDPAVRDMPAGMLPWWEESQEALILDAKEPVFATTQLSLPSRSLARRVGHLRLKEDGTLEGEVRETCTGHLSAQRKELLDERSVSGRIEEVRKQLRSRWASAVVESLALSGVDNPLEPYALAYRISVPEYAERAGKRLLLQPDLFEHGGTPAFTASTRRHWLYFPYPWSEEDSVTIGLPEGYEVEADAAPAPLSVGRTIAHRVAFEVDERVLRFHRYLAFGMDGTILIDPADYDRVKKSFESIHKRDGYTVTLRPVEAAAR
jgi:Domain of Unknown Function with PDB structure (DUF3857)